MNKAEEILARGKDLLAGVSLPEPTKEQRKKHKQRRKTVNNGQGYVYTYDSDGKPISKSRVLMEYRLGRPLRSYEVVVYLDGDRRNCVDENLAIGFRQNSPITFLRCDHCGTVGEISLLHSKSKFENFTT